MQHHSDVLTQEILTDLDPVGTFTQELEVQVDDFQVPCMSSLPALTTTYSVTSNSSSNSLLNDSRSDLISSTKLDSTINRQTNPYLLSTAIPKLTKSASLNGLDVPSSLYTYQSNKTADENVISISLADFDNLDLDSNTDCCSCNATESSISEPSEPNSLVKDPGDMESKNSYSGISLSSGVSKSNLLSPTSDTFPSGPPEVIPTEQQIATAVARRLTKNGLGCEVLSTSLPVTNSETEGRFLHHNLKRKRFLLKPQHVATHSPDPILNKKLTYTSEIPEMFNMGMMSSISESYSSQVRRKVSDCPPPMLPAHLESTFINASVRASKDDQSILPIPSHVVLNHLATTSIKHDILAVATTSRYRAKFSKYSSSPFSVLMF